MKKALIVLLIVMIFLITSCCIPLTSEAINKQDSETRLKINENKKNQDEFIKYMSDLSNALYEIDKDLADLYVKRTEAGKSKDVQKAIAYVQVEKDKCEEAISNLGNIFVPEVSEKYHNYLVDYYTGRKQFLSYLINSFSDTSNFDASKAESLADSYENSLTKAVQEFERISKILSE